MTTDKPSAPPQAAAAIARWLWTAVPVAIFAVCVVAIHNELDDTSIAEIETSIGQIGIARFWLALLVSFDVVFVTLALWTFEPVMTD